MSIKQVIIYNIFSEPNNFKKTIFGTLILLSNSVKCSLRTLHFAIK